MEFEWYALYPSRAAIALNERGPATWVVLGSLWPEEPYWLTQGPSISDRCVVVEGRFTRRLGQEAFGFNGFIAPVGLEVWSTPHRPLPPPPPPPPLPGFGPSPKYEVSPPTPLSDPGAGQEMLAEFQKLYATGAFQMGDCLAGVLVNGQGTVDTVRILRPQAVDTQVESIIVRSMRSRRFQPATMWGTPFPSPRQSTSDSVRSNRLAVAGPIAEHARLHVPRHRDLYGRFSAMR